MAQLQSGTTPSMGGVEWAMLLALSILWGGSVFFNGVIVQALPPLTVVFLRTGIAALALWTFCRVTRVAMPVPSAFTATVAGTKPVSALRQ